MKKLILTSLLLALFSFASYSQPVVEDIMEEAEELISNSINEVGTQADFLINRVAQELNLTLQNARLLLRKDMNKTKEQLKGSKLEAFNTIERLIKEVKESRATLVTTVESTILDMESIVGTSWLSSQKYTLKRISWTNQLYDTTQNYKFKIMATNIGFPDSKVTASIKSLKVENTKIEDFKIIPLEDKNEAIIEIDHSLLDSYFDKTKLKPVKVDMTFLYKKKKFLFKSKDEFDVSFYLFLFPDKAGNITIDYNELVKGWVKIGTKSERHYTGHSNHCKKHCDGHDSRVTPYDFSMSVPSTKSYPPTVGDQKMENLSGTCDGGYCGWFRFDIAPRLENNNTRAFCRYRYWSHATGCRMTADLYEYRITSEIPKKQEFILYYGQFIKFRLPSEHTSGKITAKYLGDQPEHNIVGKDFDFLKLLSIDTPSNQDYTEYTYKVIRPNIYK